MMQLRINVIACQQPPDLQQDLSIQREMTKHGKSFIALSLFPPLPAHVYDVHAPNILHVCVSSCMCGKGNVLGT